MPSPDLIEAWSASFLSELPLDTRDAFLADAFFVAAPAGTELYHPYDEARLILIHRGLARLKVGSAGGRVVTARYASAGEFLGITALVSGATVVGAEAITNCEFSALSTSTVRRMAKSDVAIAWLFAEYLAGAGLEAIDLMSINIFGSVRQRVARLLLDLAETDHGHLTVTANQQEIAWGIGSVREVVARSIRQFRDEDLLERVPNGLRLLDPGRLHAISSDLE